MQVYPVVEGVETNFQVAENNRPKSRAESTQAGPTSSIYSFFFRNTQCGAFVLRCLLEARQLLPGMRECLDRTLFWTTADLETKMREFQKYFNEHRTQARSQFWWIWVADKFCLVSTAEALSRAVPDTDCRVIL